MPIFHHSCRDRFPSVSSIDAGRLLSARPFSRLTMYRPLRPLPSTPLVGALLLTVAAFLINGNATSPLWLRILIWLGLTLYNALWWLLQVPNYQTFRKYTLPPEKQREMAHWRRSTFVIRLFSAFLLAIVSGIMLFGILASPSGISSRSLGLYELILLIALVLGVLAEWQLYYNNQPKS